MQRSKYQMCIRDRVEVLKMKTAGERIDDMITISLNNIKGLKQICCTDNYARNILLKNNEKNDIGTKFENQNYMDNALKHIASMDTLILRATIVNKYGNIYCTDTDVYKRQRLTKPAHTSFVRPQAKGH